MCNDAIVTEAVQARQRAQDERGIQADDADGSLFARIVVLILTLLPCIGSPYRPELLLATNVKERDLAVQRYMRSIFVRPV